jgi:2-polyprenyl-3-methyl-5-hydroxy-6-metoxy-1,4-benzoquinol methylase
MSTRPYLDFYGKHGIIPVHQNLSDMRAHYRRREALYRQIGLWPAMIRGRRVLEIGPGTGDNALYTAALGPSSYALMDGHPQSVAALKAKQVEGLLPPDLEVIHSDLTEWTDPRRFDVVLCEGLLPAQNDQRGFLRMVASHCDDDGVVVVTTTNCTSLLAETCRRVMLPVFRKQGGALDDLVRSLAEFFAPDLHSLPGMSRLHTDWVLDQIIHPCTKTGFFSLSSAIAVLDDEFDVLGTSPAFLTDWRWYKSIPESTQSRNRYALDQIDRFAVSFLDYRCDPVLTSPALGRAIEARCQSLWELHVDLLEGDGLAGIPVFLAELQGLRDMLPDVCAATRQSLDDYHAGMQAMLAGKDDADFGSFRTLFGRGQQYLAMMRRSKLTGRIA